MLTFNVSLPIKRWLLKRARLARRLFVRRRRMKRLAAAAAAVLCLVACVVYMGPGSRISLDQRSARGMHEANHVSRTICYCCLRGREGKVHCCEV
jgi:ferric-dicitrate binding protein FerR (iron transport regulator)